MAKAANVMRLLLGAPVLWLWLLCSGTASASKAVTAHLAAKWPETPLLLETRWVRAGTSADPGAEGGPRRGWGRAGTLTAPRMPSLHRFSKCSRVWPSEHHPLPCHPVRSTPVQFLFLPQFVLCLARGF